jgi:sugar-specific transcriptional regulator TrmB
MNEKIKKFLVDIGLSEKEALVYLALLPVDDASVIELAQSTGINRTTLYPILEDLISKRLVIEIQQGKKTKFQAEPPERVETFMRNRKAQLEEQEKVLEDIIPQMRGFVRQTGEKPVVKYYDGREGILQSIAEYYQVGDKENEEFLIYPRDVVKKLFSPEEQKRAQSVRLKHKIYMNSIFTSEDIYQSDENSSRLRLDPSKHNILCEIGIYSDRIHIHTLSQNLSAIYIKSKDVAETLKTLFKLAAQGAKEEDLNNKK